MVLLCIICGKPMRVDNDTFNDGTTRAYHSDERHVDFIRTYPEVFCHNREAFGSYAVAAVRKAPFARSHA